MVTLVIMDGFGERKEKHGNAIKLQGTPNINKLKKMFPNTSLFASGEHVGLDAGQMGNSEVGHLNIGAGRVVYQDLIRINNEIASGDFYKNKKFIKAVEHTIKNNSTLHLMGLCSDGGVHSHINHLKALIKMSLENGVNDVRLQLFLDGRDTLQTSGVGFVDDIRTYIKTNDCENVVKISSLCGRVWAMDREQRYDRVQKAYDMLVDNNWSEIKDIDTAFMDSYGAKVYDEFFEPTKLKDFKPIQEDDAVIFFNFRTDRAREITQAFTQGDFDKFDNMDFENLHFVTMAEYDATLTNVEIAYPPAKIEDNLSAVLSKSGLTQYHISETTKYAHVTFFFNGGIETAYDGEDRKLIESADVISFDKVPAMRAYEITTDVLMKITENKYDFILVNLSNADMLGHTGNLEATIEGIAAVDKCTYAIALATLTAGGDCIITADHGNAEQMLDKKGNVITSHTTNKVPFILASEKHKKAKLKKDGKLSNIAPTVLKLLGLDVPNNMDCSMF